MKLLTGQEFTKDTLQFKLLNKTFTMSQSLFCPLTKNVCHQLFFFFSWLRQDYKELKTDF